MFKSHRIVSKIIGYGNLIEIVQDLIKFHVDLHEYKKWNETPSPLQEASSRKMSAQKSRKLLISH